MAMLCDFEQLAAIEAVEHLRRVVVCLPWEKQVLPQRESDESNDNLEEEHKLDEAGDNQLATVDHYFHAAHFPRRRETRARNARVRSGARPCGAKGAKPNSTLTRKPNLLNCWCSLVAALIRREDGWGRSRRRQRLFRAELRCVRELQFGLEKPELMRRHERWLRSPFLEECCHQPRNLQAERRRRDCVELCQHYIDSRGSAVNRTVSSECARCGCSSEFDSYGDRVCWCDSCFNGCQLACARDLCLAPASPSATSTCERRWQVLVASVLRVPCSSFSISLSQDCLSRRQRQTRRLQPSVIDVHRWTRLHGADSGQAAVTQQRELLIREPPPHQMTLLYQHVLTEVTAQQRLAKRVRSRWNRMFLSMHEAHLTKTRHNALCELAHLRITARAALHGRRSARDGAIYTFADFRRHYGEWRGAEMWDEAGARADNSFQCDVGDIVNPAAEEAVLAADMGLDLATYRLLRQLEQRDILPEDYDLLGRLDESVKPKTLSKANLNRFETKTYVAPLSAPNNASPEFGINYWRLPMPIAAVPNTSEDSHCFAADFWRLPVILPETEESDSAAAPTTEGNDDDDGCSCALSVDVCGVCLVDFDNGDQLRILPCGHHFHQECIDHWLLNSSTVCPVDKRDLQHAD